MTQRKTALSIDQNVFKEMDALARKLKKTRSGVYEMAARDFLTRWHNQLVSEQLNAVYGRKEGKLDADELNFLQLSKAHFQKVLEKDE